ncbi:hypothetical protein JCM17844_05200 [Iodidimonas gelatinilytica]|uniref:SDR family NAD(P)-dependent oxidoreductase n=1 Tax=Iodidimonas gelatinilytica TaxID=1236966 RepID=A0A5A7N1A3_9PROT|nr:hypothetical protein JCM17844_05200 [Iodidimonas gelatinilytica]GER01120.1 hypothetical protein JCM17845_17430 [Iodidimonas gelatinilytica]
MALHYAAKGVFLALSGRNAERLHSVAEACRSQGAEVEEQVINVANEAAMMQWVQDLDDRKALDLVIANAGVGLSTSKERSLHETTKQTFDVNVTGVFNTIHPALERMKERKQGQIAIMLLSPDFAACRGLPLIPPARWPLKAMAMLCAGHIGGG